MVVYFLVSGSAALVLQECGDLPFISIEEGNNIQEYQFQGIILER
jgi:hypothetical protein